MCGKCILITICTRIVGSEERERVQIVKKQRGQYKCEKGPKQCTKILRVDTLKVHTQTNIFTYPTILTELLRSGSLSMAEDMLLKSLSAATISTAENPLVSRTFRRV